MRPKLTGVTKPISKTEREKGREKKTQVDQRTPRSNSTLTLEFVSANPEETSTRQTEREEENVFVLRKAIRGSGSAVNLEQGLPHTHKRGKETQKCKPNPGNMLDFSHTGQLERNSKISYAAGWK